MSNLPTASFPSSVWDTVTQRRVDANTYTDLGPEGTLELLAEILAETGEFAGSHTETLISPVSA